MKTYDDCINMKEAVIYRYDDFLELVSIQYKSLIQIRNFGFYIPKSYKNTIIFFAAFPKLQVSVVTLDQ